jgi:hypothetical protein
MIKLLSNIGRSTVVFAAFATVVGCAIWGYTLAEGYDLLHNGVVGFAGLGRITLTELVGLVAGGLLGILVAGAVFGAIATLYDIRDNIRMVVARKGGRLNLDWEDDDRRSSAADGRREPYIS